MLNKNKHVSSKTNDKKPTAALWTTCINLIVVGSIIECFSEIDRAMLTVFAGGPSLYNSFKLSVTASILSTNAFGICSGLIPLTAGQLASMELNKIVDRLVKEIDNKPWNGVVIFYEKNEVIMYSLKEKNKMEHLKKG